MECRDNSELMLCKKIWEKPVVAVRLDPDSQICTQIPPDKELRLLQ